MSWYQKRVIAYCDSSYELNIHLASLYQSTNLASCRSLPTILKVLASAFHDETRPTECLHDLVIFLSFLFLDSLNSVWFHLQASLCCKSKDWCVLRSFAIHSLKILRSTLISELLTFFTIALQPTQYGSKSTGNVLGASGCLFATRPKYLLRHFLRSSVGQHFVRTLFSKKRQCPWVHQWFCNLWRLWACNAALLLLHYLHFWLKDFKVCKVKTSWTDAV